MPVATYTTINGMLVHESRGGVESFYFPDTLGSLTTVRSATGVKTYGAEYWPYGEIQTETGTNPSPWSFVGLLGYLRDTASRLYVRARHYRPGLARWQTVDPLWPDESAYGYVNESPMETVDVQGRWPEKPPFFEIFPKPRWWPRQIPWPGHISPIPGIWPGPKHRPRPVGGGRANYDNGWTPGDFGYGNYCGYWRNGKVQHCKEAGEIDCLDKACKKHDDDNPGVIDYIPGRHHRTLCFSLAKCSCVSEYPMPGRDQNNCLVARSKMMALYCLHGAIVVW